LAISWVPAEIETGRIEMRKTIGETVDISWGLVRRAFRVVQTRLDRRRSQQGERGQCLQHAQRHLGGSGRHDRAFDGFIDSYFQEVYLEAESLPLFSNIASQVSPDALDHYVEALEGEVAGEAAAATGLGEVELINASLKTFDELAQQGIVEIAWPG
jgi:hypothetical protein